MISMSYCPINNRGGGQKVSLFIAALFLLLTTNFHIFGPCNLLYRKFATAGYNYAQLTVTEACRDFGRVP